VFSAQAPSAGAQGSSGIPAGNIWFTLPSKGLCSERDGCCMTFRPARQTRMCSIIIKQYWISVRECYFCILYCDLENFLLMISQVELSSSNHYNKLSLMIPHYNQGNRSDKFKAVYVESLKFGIVAIFIGFNLVFISCNSSEDKKQVFTETFSSKGDIFIKEEKLTDPGSLTIMNDFLVVGNTKGSPLIEIYSLTSTELLNSFLDLGNGPNEVLTIGNIQYIPGQEELLIADLFKRKIFSYSLREIINKENPEPRILYERADKSPLLFDKLFKSKHFLIAESRDPRGRLITLQEDGSESNYFMGYPDKNIVDERLSDINNASIYASAITISPSLDNVALATYSAGMIDLCKIENDHIVPQWNYTEFYPQGMMIVPMGDGVAVAHTKDSRSGFTSISSSDKFIYSLYSGKLLEDKTYPYGNKIYVVSWDGKETYKILLDKSINRLAVDAKDEYIYGITPEMDIVKFKIPDNR
jgi:hypothetical protein